MKSSAKRFFAYQREIILSNSSPQEGNDAQLSRSAVFSKVCVWMKRTSKPKQNKNLPKSVFSSALHFNKVVRIIGALSLVNRGDLDEST